MSFGTTPPHGEGVVVASFHRSVGDAPSFGGSANASGATAVKCQDMGMMRVKYLENSPFQQGENESSDGCRDMWRWWLPR